MQRYQKHLPIILMLLFMQCSFCTPSFDRRVGKDWRLTKSRKTFTTEKMKEATARIRALKGHHRGHFNIFHSKTFLTLDKDKVKLHFKNASCFALFHPLQKHDLITILLCRFQRKFHNFWETGYIFYLCHTQLQWRHEKV